MVFNQTIRRNARWLFRLTALLCLASSNSYARQDELPPKPIFKLVKGQGTEVCEAYLERLNKTEFLDNDPTKGRVTEPLLKGFIDLKPVPLTVEEIKRIILKIHSFEQNQDQDIIDKYIEKYKGTKKAESQILINKMFLDMVKKYMQENQNTPFIRYQIKLDLDNDGVATNTVAKNNNSVYIVDEALHRLDEDHMKAILGNQEILRWPGFTQFPPLAAPINAFAYKGKYYFDGFQGLSQHPDQRAAHIVAQTPMILKVFIHENHVTSEACEYQWLNATQINGSYYRDSYQ